MRPNNENQRQIEINLDLERRLKILEAQIPTPVQMANIATSMSNITIPAIQKVLPSAVGPSNKRSRNMLAGDGTLADFVQDMLERQAVTMGKLIENAITKQSLEMN